MNDLIPFLVCGGAAVLIGGMVLVITVFTSLGTLRGEMEKLRREVAWLQKWAARVSESTRREEEDDATDTEAEANATLAEPPPPAARPPGAPGAPVPLQTLLEDAARSMPERPAKPPLREVLSRIADPELPPSAAEREPVLIEVPSEPPVPLIDATPADASATEFASTSPPSPAETSPPPPPATPAPEPPAHEPSALERNLAVRAAVWLGGIALALAGVYAIKYLFDKNLLTPWVRIGLGLFAGVATLVAGQWLRFRHPHYTRIATALAAVGIAVLFASLLAGVNVEHIIPPTVGFACMAGVTAIAVVLSLREGPLIAMLGLVGGYATPALIDTGHHEPGPLFGYLILLQVGLTIVGRRGRRNWWPIAATALVCSMGWVILWLVMYDTPAHHAVLAPFLLMSLASSIFSATGAGDEPGAATYRPAGVGPRISPSQVVAWVGTVVAAVLMAVLVGRGEFQTSDWAFYGLLSAAAIVMDRLSVPRRRAAEGESVTSGASRWRGRFVYHGLAAFALVLTVFLLAARDVWDDRFIATVWIFGVLFAGGAFACFWSRPHAAVNPGDATDLSDTPPHAQWLIKPVYWMAVCIAAGLGFLGVAYLMWFNAGVVHIRWWRPELVLTGAYAGGLVLVLLRRRRTPGAEPALVMLLGAVAVFLSLAAADRFSMINLTLALAGEMVALAWLYPRLRIDAGRLLVAGLLVALMLRLALNGEVLNYPISHLPIVNELALLYLVPIAAILITARLLAARGDEELPPALEVCAAILGVVFITAQLHHLAHHGAFAAQSVTFKEWGAWFCAWLASGIAMLEIGRWHGRLRQHLGATGLIIIGIAAALTGLVTILGAPVLLHHENVGGWPVMNWLLLVYGGPAMLMAVAGWRAGRAGQREFSATLMIGSVIMALALVTLEVRQAWHPQLFDDLSLGFPEQGVAVCAWLILGGALLVAARRFARPEVYIAAVILIVVAAWLSAVVGLIFQNPLLTGDDVGARFLVNWLPLVYGGPALLAVLLARRFTREGLGIVAAGLMLFALVMGFALVTLEVRQAWQGATLAAHTLPQGERYAYSAAWVGFGIVLLILGIALRGRDRTERRTLPPLAGLPPAFAPVTARHVPTSQLFRWASLAVMTVAVFKVFLFDIAGLRDLYRVMSFLGLGVSLLGLAFIYQRFVFRRVAV